MLRLILFLGAMASLCAQPRENALSLVLADFDQRVRAYVAIHKRVERELPPMKPTKAVEMLHSQRLSLAKGIIAARKDALAGDVITPAIAKELRGLLKLAMTGPNAVRIARSLDHAEPQSFVLKINTPYPPRVPLQSMPPTVLANLPSLPPELEYRLVGQALLLYDEKANLIVDFLQAALP
ncbi:hypothetical protein [Bryobacter aggregatus]|uniref:hypothetical protein n=1 Tax=Bryobacter aggregatus TaxID=360054 RepID=UPI0004E0E598|nr:hypothetical protein [Bryobacter aggregatus]